MGLNPMQTAVAAYQFLMGVTVDQQGKKVEDPALAKKNREKWESWANTSPSNHEAPHPQKK
jgi:hypothetical protein